MVREVVALLLAILATMLFALWLNPHQLKWTYTPPMVHEIRR